MITLKHIGDACALSKATVSLALRDDPRIPEATRTRVKQAAQKLGYRMNPLVAAHSTYVRTARESKTTTVLGYLTNWAPSAQPASSLVNQRILAGMDARAKELGYRVDRFQLMQQGRTERRLSRILAARNIMGVVIADLAKAHSALDLDWQNVASVAIGYGLRSPLVDRVCHDQYGSMRLLMSELTQLGYKRIGLAMEHRQDERTSNMILAAYLAHQQLQGNDPVPPLLPAEWNKDVFLPWYRRQKPDVIVSVLDDVVSWLREEGVSVPNKVGFASVCVLKAGQSGIYQHFEAIGAAGVDQLVSQLHTNKRGLPEHPATNLILGSWRLGESVRNITSSERRIAKK
ncbi:LacI family DNA-binding transcriptional regulator [Nibricoccus aquaticus]|uniref:substrate-binding domain-containing protein n=1 Tax=Nibricoccus aquaticus TaxID=2576891 RepID=UPI0010FD71A7|nr:LacI family DNA-binding transcriptional regulator [Nibricoccus aquaticus]